MNPADSGAKPAEIKDLDELLAHAHAIEIEAEERYADLADQMEVHNNQEVAVLFRKLAEVEGAHAREILERAKGRDLPDIPYWEYKWTDSESPEAADLLEAHYLMTPHHALMLALRGEEKALAFFERLAKTATDNDVRKMAEEFAEEEREHVKIVKKYLEEHPEPPDGWDHDDDPPVLQE